MTTSWRGLSPLLWSTLGALAAVEAARRYVHGADAAADVGAWGAFFTAFGVIYAIIVGFLLLDVLNRYGAISQTVEDELNAVECLRDFLVYVEEGQQPACERIRAALADYVRSVATEEWSLMSTPDEDVPSDTSPSLYALMRSCRKLQVDDEADAIVLRSLIATLADVTRFRTRRISLANEQIPPRLWTLVGFMSYALVSGFAWMVVASPWADRAMTVSLAISVHLLYLILADLDHPFYGVWNVSRRALDELAARFEREADAPS